MNIQSLEVLRAGGRVGGDWSARYEIAAQWSSRLGWCPDRDGWLRWFAEHGPESVTERQIGAAYAYWFRSQ